MRILIVRTHSQDNERVGRTLEYLGHYCRSITWDDKAARYETVVEFAQGYQPDFIVYIGAVEALLSNLLPRPDFFHKLKHIAPISHICFDASDTPWWPLLELYHRESCFSVQVSIDGSKKTPLAEHSDGLIKLAPVDPRLFSPLPWQDRTVRLGMGGGWGHPGSSRAIIMETLTQQSGLIWFNGWQTNKTIQEYCDFLCNCKIAFCCPMNASGNIDHVKARVVEAGFAGCCLLERSGSPTEDWFRPDIDYLAYENPEDVVEIMNTLDDAAVQRMAIQYQKKVVAQHSPEVFWRDIFTKARIAC